MQTTTQAPEGSAPRRSSRPSIRDRAATRVCPNCGKPSPERRSAKGRAPLYCDDKCKREANNRDLRDGLSLVTFVKAWRVDRGTGEIAQASFRRICEIADMLNEDDRRAARPRADYAAAVKLHNEYHSVCDLRYGKRKVEEARARSGEEAPAKHTPAKADPLAELRAKLADPATTDNERAVLQAALEIMQASA